MLLPLLLTLALSPLDARSRPLGATVTLEGWISVPPATFASFMNQDQGFVLSDPHAGIYVSTTQPLTYPLATPLQVKGVLADDGHGLLILRATQIRPRRAPRRDISPRVLPLSQINESTEGLLATVEATLARPPQSDLPYGYKLFLRDAAHRELQIFLPAHLPPDPSWTPGRTLRITGFVAQYNRTYELVPRFPRDIQPR